MSYFNSKGEGLRLLEKFNLDGQTYCSVLYMDGLTDILLEEEIYVTGNPNNIRHEADNRRKPALLPHLQEGARGADSLSIYARRLVAPTIRLSRDAANGDERRAIRARAT